MPSKFSDTFQAHETSFTLNLSFGQNRVGNNGDQEAQAPKQGPLLKEYNTHWNKRARNTSYPHSKQDSRLPSLKRKSLVDKTLLGGYMLMTQSIDNQLPKNLKT